METARAYATINLLPQNGGRSKVKKIRGIEPVEPLTPRSPELVIFRHCNTHPRRLLRGILSHSIMPLALLWGPFHHGGTTATRFF